MEVSQVGTEMFISFCLHHYLISNVFPIVLKAKAVFLKLQFILNIRGHR